MTSGANSFDYFFNWPHLN